MIGEIRDAQTAQEALALAESGPLVLASLHARSTELGLQKMIRLLGNSEAQSQALAHALRGILCQALLPSVKGDRYHLATECLTVNPEVADMIAGGQVSGLRAWMEAREREGCHTNERFAARVAGGRQDQCRRCAQRDDRPDRLRRASLSISYRAGSRGSGLLR